MIAICLAMMLQAPPAKAEAKPAKIPVKTYVQVPGPSVKQVKGADGKTYYVPSRTYQIVQTTAPKTAGDGKAAKKAGNEKVTAGPPTEKVESGTFVPLNSTMKFYTQRPAADAPKPGTLDAQIQQALASHPDLRIAQLQVELAQAKLEQERQGVISRITTARAAVDSLKPIVASRAELLEKIRNVGSSQSEVAPLEDKLSQSKHDLAMAEAELQAAIGSPTTGVVSMPLTFDFSTSHPKSAVLNETLSFLNAVQFRAETPQSKGFLADFPMMLDRDFTPDKKSGSLKDVLTGLVAKAAGMNGKPTPVIRLADRFDPTTFVDPGKVTLQGESGTLLLWLEQLVDDFNMSQNVTKGQPDGQYALYVREYGLIFAARQQAPVGAPTVAEFYKQAQAEKAARERMAEQAPPAKAKD